MNCIEAQDILHFTSLTSNRVRAEHLFGDSYDDEGGDLLPPLFQLLDGLLFDIWLRFD